MNSLDLHYVTLLETSDPSLKGLTWSDRPWSEQGKRHPFLPRVTPVSSIANWTSVPVSQARNFHPDPYRWYRALRSKTKRRYLSLKSHSIELSVSPSQH
jgi:hypothetical protein